MSDEEKDPKDGDDNSDDNGQSEKKLPTDEKVEVSKSELETLQKKSKDFEAMVESKRKKDASSRTLPGEKPTKEKDDSSDDDEDDDELTEEFVTKKDFKKTIEKQAITELHKNPDLADHWDEVMEFWTPRSTDDTDTVEGLVAIGNRAFKVYQSEHPSKPDKPEDDSAKNAAAVGTDAGLGKGKEKKPEAEKKSILTKKEKMTDWYKGKKK